MNGNCRKMWLHSSLQEKKFLSLINGTQLRKRQIEQTSPIMADNALLGGRTLE